MDCVSRYGFITFLLFTQLCQAQIVSMEKVGFQTPQGIYLEADIYLPDTLNTYPTVLLRTPYGKYQYKSFGQYFAEAGFVAIVQDVRGKFGSSGEFFPFYHEREDGLATLDWIVKQAWSNGKIGMYGVSYPAFCALTLAADQHPALQAIVNVSGWVKPADMATEGGALHLLLNLPWLLHEETLTTRNMGDYDIDSLLWHLPVKDALQSVGIKSKAWEESNLLDQVNADFNFDQVNLPILHITGAYDFVKKATLSTYQALQSRSKPNQKLIFGPWFHNQYLTSLTEVGILECGESAEMGYAALLAKSRKWFTRYLKAEEEVPDQPNDPEVFTLIGNNWTEQTGFPYPKGCQESWYFGSEKGANSRLGDGTLSTTFSSAKSDTFHYDPAHPVLTNGGANFHFFPAQLGVKDQTTLEERKDILVYTSPSFEKASTLAGPIQVQLFAATDGPDTDFTAKLVLIDEDGVAMNMADGIIRGRYKNGQDQEELLIPHKIYEYQIDLGITAFHIPKGYQIRVEIASSNFPKYDRNANTAINPFEAQKLRVAHQTIYLGPQYPSRIILPIICE